jgi:hypothetical protein
MLPFIQNDAMPIDWEYRFRVLIRLIQLPPYRRYGLVRRDNNIESTEEVYPFSILTMENMNFEGF